MKEKMGKQSKGQSIMEYGIAFAMIVAMGVGMQLYVKRGLQSRYRDMVKDTTSSIQTMVTTENAMVTPDGTTLNLQVPYQYQYEPDSTSTHTEYSLSEVVEERMGFGGSLNRIHPIGTYSSTLTNTEQH